MTRVTWVTSPPASVRSPAPRLPKKPSEYTLLPITSSPGTRPFRPKQYISFPDSPDIAGIGQLRLVEGSGSSQGHEYGRTTRRLHMPHQRGRAPRDCSLTERSVTRGGAAPRIF